MGYQHIEVELSNYTRSEGGLDYFAPINSIG